jgi:hypothetical protein
MERRYSEKKIRRRYSEKKQAGSLAVSFVEALLPAGAGAAIGYGTSGQARGALIGALAGAGSPLLYRGFFQRSPALKLPLLVIGLGCSAAAVYLAWTRPKMYTADQWLEQAALAERRAAESGAAAAGADA